MLLNLLGQGVMAPLEQKTVLEEEVVAVVEDTLGPLIGSHPLRILQLPFPSAQAVARLAQHLKVQHLSRDRG
jgi:hypothetical protein